MRKWIVLLLVVCILFVGCEMGENKSTFVTVERYDTFRVVYHKDTNVMYVVNNSGIFRLLVNADGTPQLWEEDSE